MVDTYKRYWAISFWIIFGFVLMPLLVFPATRAENVITSKVVSKIYGKNVYCFVARRNPLSGCYLVAQPVTWSNHNELKQIIYSGKQDSAANKIKRNGDTIFVIILLTTLIIFWIKDKRVIKSN